MKCSEKRRIKDKKHGILQNNVKNLNIFKNSQ